MECYKIKTNGKEKKMMSGKMTQIKSDICKNHKIKR